MSDYQEVEGFLWPKHGFPVDNFYAVRNLKLRAGDIVISTFPKCGNTWMSYIVWGILNEGRSPPQPAEMKKHIPFPDKFGTQALELLPSPRVMITHVPPPNLPLNPEAKYIVVFRNPFDTCVSFFNFARRKTDENTFDFTFDQFFEGFFAGKTPFGDFFEHFRVWYPLREDGNILFLTYEELLADKMGGVRRVAAFLGSDHAGRLESDSQMLENIVRHSSFDYMKQKMEFIVDTAVGPEKIDFFRKGIIGDWKNYFSESQKNRLYKKMQVELEGTELLNFWKEALQM